MLKRSGRGPRRKNSWSAQLYCVLERMPGCKKGATSVERAGDIVCDGSSRDQRTERPERESKSAKCGWHLARGGIDVACLLVRVHASSVDHGPREPCGVLAPRASEFEPSSVVCDQSLMLG